MLPCAALAQKNATAYPAKYSGGSLPLDHHKVRATLAKDEVVFMQRGHRFAVPMKSITEISCGTEARHRLGTVFGVVPVIHLGANETHYVGVSWIGANGDGQNAEALLELSAADYRGFLAALEQATGIKAVDTNQVPTVVRYRI